MQDHGIDHYSQNLERLCQNENCRRTYTIRQYLKINNHYFPRPFNYRAGCDTYCLQCWLGIEPGDSFGDHEDIPEPSTKDLLEPDERCPHLTLATETEDWSYEAAYHLIMDGDILPAFHRFFDNGLNLAVMPIARLHIERTIAFPGPIIFYPAGMLNIDQLNLIPNKKANSSLAELCSASSGITRETLEHHPLLAFPCQFDWHVMRTSSHKYHLDLVRQLSEKVDRLCLDFVRYRSCALGPAPDEGLPAHAGQVADNHMMAGALLYCGALQEARIIGGAAFSHYLTRGTGLPLDQPEWNSFPQDGEVGKLVNHALSLYTALLEASNPTIRFVQAFSLLEFLACPDKYLKYEMVNKIVARYVAKTRSDYEKLCKRLYELTKEYRTKLVHIGERLENIVSTTQARENLFLELDSYIRPIIDHMIEHSEKSFEDYLEARKALRPFDT